jgi:hypothetical protein
MDALDLILEAQTLGLLPMAGPLVPLHDVAKGVCPYCLKHIGRGLHRHKLACKERKQ